jgi:hypothetical protein
VQPMQFAVGIGGGDKLKIVQIVLFDRLRLLRFEAVGLQFCAFLNVFRGEFC